MEAIKSMENGEICMCGPNDEQSFYKIEENIPKVYINNGWYENNYSFKFMYLYQWYTAKEAEEKFIPTKAELLGLWYHKDLSYFSSMNGNGIQCVVDRIKNGWRPATEEDRDEFYKKVVEELQK